MPGNSTPLLTDTIAAVATPPGIGGIAVIRISGIDAVAAADRIFRGRNALVEAASHTVHYGTVTDGEERGIDDVLATLFLAPHSYTGENTVEISCHGGAAVTRRILERILEAGVRQAQPGEFTRRAFLNGRMDLAQAEAVADLIHARTDAAQAASRAQLEGKLSGLVRDIRERLIHTTAMLELNLDFSEEDVEFTSREEQRMLIDDAGSLIRRALESYAVGRVVREGLSVAIVGRPNAGKSSLLNAILGVRRAIVTDTPGTTRDYIEESLVAHGALLRFTDTAGLRESTDPIEREGIGHSISRLRAADVVALVEDLTLSGDLAEAIDEDLSFLAAHEVEPGRIVLLLNKSDLSSLPDDELQGIAALVPHPLFVTSALTGAGLDQLLRWCAGKSTLLNRGSLEGDILVTNARHADCLMRALHHLEAAKGSIASGLTEEFLSLEMRAATDALGEIIGEVTSEEILRSIFDRFCIGK